MAIQGFFGLYYIIAILSAWLLSVLLKSIVFAFKEKSFSLRNGFSNGGMPSSHSAVVSSVTAAVFMMQGFSDLFFVALVFSLIVISDAFGFRRNVGVQGDTINNILKGLKKDPVKVVHGHTFFQVLAGIILGVLAAVITYYTWF